MAHRTHRRLVRMKLNGKVKRVQSLQSSWKLFKTTVIEAQPRWHKYTAKKGRGLI